MMKPALVWPVAFLLFVALTACAGGDKESQETAVRRLIGQSYGAQYFDQIEQVQYTYNVRIGEQHNRRFWIWEPGSDRVTFDAMDYTDPVTYFRRDLQIDSSNLLKSIDAWFINDNYWFLFPFHVARDTRTIIEDVGLRKLPMGEGKAFCVVVTYPAEAGGETPGDVYELYLDQKVRLVQWVYRREGSKTPTRIATWDDHRKLGQLVFSMNHQGENGNFQVWFTHVGVKLTGVDGWIFID
jgi:hypothetical protein